MSRLNRPSSKLSQLSCDRLILSFVFLKTVTLILLSLIRTDWLTVYVVYLNFSIKKFLKGLIFLQILEFLWLCGRLVSYCTYKFNNSLCYAASNFLKHNLEKKSILSYGPYIWYHNPMYFFCFGFGIRLVLQE